MYKFLESEDGGATASVELAPRAVDTAEERAKRLSRNMDRNANELKISYLSALVL